MNRILVSTFLVLATTLRVDLANAQQATIEGAWNAEVYRLAAGPVLAVRGHIFFSPSRWQVLFFVMDGEEARRGSGEGGSYTLVGNSLTLQHHYLLVAGDEMPGLPRSPLRMEARDGTGPTEPTEITLSDDRLILHFPSGNSMEFARSR